MRECDCVVIISWVEEGGRELYVFVVILVVSIGIFLIWEGV